MDAVHPFPGNLLLVSANPASADELNRATGVIGFAAALSVAVLLAARWRAATPGVRRASAPAAAGAVTLLFLSGLLLQGAFTSYQSPFLVWPTLVGLLLVPVVFLVGIWRTWVARAAVADLLVELGATRGTPLQSALAKALRDPTLMLAYWLPEFASYVDSGGQAGRAPRGFRRRLTAVVEQDGERVAAIVYDASLAEERKLLDAVDRRRRVRAAERTAVGRATRSRERAGRLESEDPRGGRQGAPPARAEPARRRAAAAGRALDAAHLLKARIRDDPATAVALAAKANAELAESLEELRELARGIHPSALDHGLAVALESLAAQSVVSDARDVDLAERLPRAGRGGGLLRRLAKLSRTSTSTRRRRRRPCASSRARGGALIEITDDGIGGADDANGSGLRGLADRVEALERAAARRQPARRRHDGHAR